jgi:hypothetical protein
VKKVTPAKDELIGTPRPLTRDAAHGEVKRELAVEMANAFARANEKVERAMEELELRGRALARARTEERAALAIAFNEQRERARTALWELRVHREALGLRDHRALDQAWSVPPEEST